MIVYMLAATLAAQSGGLVWLTHKIVRDGAEERRNLVNHALSTDPHSFSILAAASRPDETVEAVAEARGPRTVRSSPLGL